MTAFAEPPRLEVARLPTPLEPLTRYSAQVRGVDVWVKRDDLTGCTLSGNKVRKLEYVFGRAVAAGARGVVTCGGINSNHCRATAMLAARLGLQRHLFLRTADGKPPSRLQGNTLIDAIAGSEITWITPADYARRDALMAAYAEASGRRGTPLMVIPEGASDAVGACGYIRAAAEIQSQLDERGLEVDAVVHAMGSGGTTAGLLAGRSLCGASWRVIGIPVCDDAVYFKGRVDTVLDELATLGAADVDRTALDIVDGYQGRGYGLTTPEELVRIRDFCRLEGLLLDPCYTGKALQGLDREIRSGRFRPGSRILFLHTGGVFSNFSYEQDWAAVL